MMDKIREEYEVPEVETFGELDFEPANIQWCSTQVTCDCNSGNCSTDVAIPV